MRHAHCITWNMVRNTEEHENWEMHTVEPGRWWESWPTRKMRNSHWRTRNMAKMTNEQNEKLTWKGRKYGEKHWKTRKMKNTHCRYRNMARNSEKREIWKIHTVGTGLWQQTWKRLKMSHKHCMTWNIARKTEKREKWDMYTAGPALWRENW